MRCCWCTCTLLSVHVYSGLLQITAENAAATAAALGTPAPRQKHERSKSFGDNLLRVSDVTNSDFFRLISFVLNSE